MNLSVSPGPQFITIEDDAIVKIREPRYFRELEVNWIRKFPGLCFRIVVQYRAINLVDCSSIGRETSLTVWRTRTESTQDQYRSKLSLHIVQSIFQAANFFPLIFLNHFPSVIPSFSNNASNVSSVPLRNRGEISFYAINWIIRITRLFNSVLILPIFNIFLI